MNENLSQTDQSHIELCETESVNENLSQTDQSQIGLFCPKLTSLKLGFFVLSFCEIESVDENLSHTEQSQLRAEEGLKTDGCQLVKFVPVFSESSWERSSTWRPSTMS